MSQKQTPIADLLRKKRLTAADRARLADFAHAAQHLSVLVDSVITDVTCAGFPDDKQLMAEILEANKKVLHA